MRLRAEYDNDEVDDARELVFVAGDVLEDAVKVDAAWYRATLNGVTGLVPADFVAEVGDDADLTQPRAPPRRMAASGSGSSSSSSSYETYSSSSGGGGGPGSRPPPVRPLPTPTPGNRPTPVVPPSRPGASDSGDGGEAASENGSDAGGDEAPRNGGNSAGASRGPPPKPSGRPLPTPTPKARPVPAAKKRSLPSRPPVAGGGGGSGSGSGSGGGDVGSTSSTSDGAAATASTTAGGGEGPPPPSSTASAPENVLLSEDGVHSGWLMKKGGFRHNWKRRWFVCRDGTLYYLAKEEEDTRKANLEKKCKGQVALLVARLDTSYSHRVREHVFKVGWSCWGVFF